MFKFGVGMRRLSSVAVFTAAGTACGNTWKPRGTVLSKLDSSLHPSAGASSSIAHSQKRYFAFFGGEMTVWKGFATSDIIIKESGRGGPQRRGIYAERRLGCVQVLHLRRALPDSGTRVAAPSLGAVCGM